MRLLLVLALFLIPGVTVVSAVLLSPALQFIEGRAASGSHTSLLCGFSVIVAHVVAHHLAALGAKDRIGRYVLATHRAHDFGVQRVATMVAEH